jgi:hypothetical protein
MIDIYYYPVFLLFYYDNYLLSYLLTEFGIRDIFLCGIRDIMLDIEKYEFLVLGIIISLILYY